MIGQRHEIARLQSDFYRDQFRKILRWLLIAAFTILILVGAIIYLILFHPADRYFANTVDGIILSMPNPR